MNKYQNNEYTFNCIFPFISMGNSIYWYTILLVWLESNYKHKIQSFSFILSWILLYSFGENEIVTFHHSGVFGCCDKGNKWLVKSMKNNFWLSIKLPRVLRINYIFERLFCLGGNAITKTIVRTDIKGRLLTPEEGCGYSKVANTRIVGGAPAKVGAWPWLALVGRESFFGFEFECGN